MGSRLVDVSNDFANHDSSAWVGVFERPGWADAPSRGRRHFATTTRVRAHSHPWLERVFRREHRARRARQSDARRRRGGGCRVLEFVDFEILNSRLSRRH